MHQVMKQHAAAKPLANACPPRDTQGCMRAGTRAAWSGRRTGTGAATTTCTPHATAPMTASPCTPLRRCARPTGRPARGLPCNGCRAAARKRRACTRRSVGQHRQHQGLQSKLQVGGAAGVHQGELACRRAACEPLHALVPGACAGRSPHRYLPLSSLHAQALCVALLSYGAA